MGDKVRFAWHVHHNVIIETLFEPIAKRRAYIRKNKPVGERALRLKLLRIVKGRPPQSLENAGRAYRDTWRAYDDMLRVYRQYPKAGNEILQDYDKVRRACAKAWWAYTDELRFHINSIDALHRRECPDCPWDGQTIFPQGDSEKA